MIERNYPRLFFTGATGYLGGDAWTAILGKHPEWQSSSTCLVRNETRGRLLQKKYPSVRLVIGDLSDSELLEHEASRADVVIHCASIEDPVSSQALANGLKRRSGTQPAYWIALSGTDNLAWKTVEDGSYGQTSDLQYDDLEGISQVIDLPDSAPHRDVEKIQLEAVSESIKLAIVCAPCVYGTGCGVGNTRSIQLPDMAKYTLEHGSAFQVGKGLNRWPNIHVQDLSDLILALVDNALQGGERATWGQEGYYFCENGEHVWGHMAKLVSQAAKDHGYISDANVVSWSAQEADERVPFGALFWGTNSRCISLRARKLLAWEPKQHPIQDEVVKTLKDEARSSRK
ncbi:hypothetical protein PV11_04158 [Exophiala sideris]|uniref:NAD-dependent epimerase/dehydratase domain-containing protein n=1 Tax=Exophiala sideris TaxID=1016849 RepID=A0A0D1YGT7_9EURO|nr:hypothetical protein PV11_04158 [Exophiala sideris]